MSHPLGLELDQINPDLPEEDADDEDAIRYVVPPTKIHDDETQDERELETAPEEVEPE